MIAAAAQPRIAPPRPSVRCPIALGLVTMSIISAISREKQIKGFTRLKKMAWIVYMDPEWRDLSEEWSKE